MGKSAEPVWTKPAWITAIVGLISAFLTIPNVIGDYLTKQQDIEIAKQETESIRLSNLASKQKQEFEIVNSTLEQKGGERIYVLRYLAATLDDPSAKEWAENEISYLDELVSLQKALADTQQRHSDAVSELDLAHSRSSLETTTLKNAIKDLRNEISQRNEEIRQVRQKAGIEDSEQSNIENDFFTVDVKLDWESRPTGAAEYVDIVMTYKNDLRFEFFCGTDQPECLSGWFYYPPSTIVVSNREVFKSIVVHTYVREVSGGTRASKAYPVNYQCISRAESVVCNIGRLERPIEYFIPKVTPKLNDPAS